MSKYNIRLILYLINKVFVANYALIHKSGHIPLITRGVTETCQLLICKVSWGQISFATECSTGQGGKRTAAKSTMLVMLINAFTSLTDTSTNEAEPNHTDCAKPVDTNHNFDTSELQIQDDSDASCEDLLRFVKEKLDRFEMENSAGSGQLAEERRRRYGSVNRQPNVSRLTFDKERYRYSGANQPPALSRFVSEPGPQQNDVASPTTDIENRPHSSQSNHRHTRKFSSSSETSSGVFDISGQTNDNKFPWLKDQATQCRILTADDEKQEEEPTAEQVLSPILNYMNTSNAQREYNSSPRTTRSQSQSAM